jgi:FixJ family two-component response regulator
MTGTHGTKDVTASLIAIVDDDDLVRHSTASLLRSMGYATCVFASAGELLDAFPSTPACVLSDYQMPGMSGLDLLGVLRQQAPLLPVIIMTGQPDADLEGQALREGAAGFLTKPLDAALLERAIITSLG